MDGFPDPQRVIQSGQTPSEVALCQGMRRLEGAPLCPRSCLGMGCPDSGLLSWPQSPVAGDGGQQRVVASVQRCPGLSRTGAHYLCNHLFAILVEPRGEREGVGVGQSHPVVPPHPDGAVNEQFAWAAVRQGHLSLRS